MKQTWRWFGPGDKVSLNYIRQAGATGVVSALHQIKPGDLWTPEAIAERKAMIEAAGLSWEIVESLPVTEAMRMGAPEAKGHLENWIQSMENLAAAGIKVIVYNFMPILDWTRTDLFSRTETGALTLKFDLEEFAAFDIFILERENAEQDYTPEVVASAKAIFAELSDEQKQKLGATILAGLPGAMEHWSLDSFRAQLALYKDIDEAQLRQNLTAFLKEVVPHAERLGVKLGCHPDDPPWPIFGLPRIVSTEQDYKTLVDSVPSPANGIAFCAGSLGTRGDNDLPGMMERLGPHVNFLHLRNVTRDREAVPCSFLEDEHLSGSTDMVAFVKAIIAEERRRKAEGREDFEIALRPDHGQAILDDQEKNTQPGYSAIGRLKGLAELRGVITALEYQSK